MTTETLKNPSVPTITNPIGIDAAIQRLQVFLGTLAWIEKSFGRAWSIPVEVLGKKTVEPMVYQGTKEYYPVLPNDALKAYSFFRVIGSRNTEEYAANLNTGGAYIFNDPVDLIVWGDLKAIDPSKDYVFKEELIRDVMNKLNLDTNVQVVRVWDDKIEDVFRGYNLEGTNRGLLMYPYTAFRIEMNLKYQFKCDGEQGLILLESGGFIAR